MASGLMKVIGSTFMKELSGTNYITRDTYLLRRMYAHGVCNVTVTPVQVSGADGYGVVIQNLHGKL